MMMQLRRAANHPLLLRRFYDDDKILVMATEMIQVWEVFLLLPNFKVVEIHIISLYTI